MKVVNLEVSHSVSELVVRTQLPHFLVGLGIVAAARPEILEHAQVGLVPIARPRASTELLAKMMIKLRKQK